MKINCEQIASGIKEELKNKIKQLKDKPVLHIVKVGSDYASEIYVRNKIKDCEEVGIKTELHSFVDSVHYQTLMGYISNLTDLNQPIMVQLPLPFPESQTQRVLDLIPPSLDVDNLSVANKGLLSCTPSAILKILNHVQPDITNKNVLIINRTDHIGKQLINPLLEKDANVSIAHSKTSAEKLKSKIHNADIIISATGVPKLINLNNIGFNKKIIIDAGISRNLDNKICGDCDKILYVEDALLITPVPKGVGLITRTSLLENVVNKYDR